MGMWAAFSFIISNGLGCLTEFVFVQVVFFFFFFFFSHDYDKQNERAFTILIPRMIEWILARCYYYIQLTSLHYSRGQVIIE